MKLAGFDIGNSVSRWERIALILSFLTVNALFVTKYGMRISHLWPLAVAGVAIVQYLVIAKCLPLLSIRSDTPLRSLPRGKRGDFIRIMLKICAVAGIALMLVMQLSIDPYSIGADRWSALHNTIDYLFEGEYPYSAPTHLGGRASPFPVWIAIHIPFWLCNDVGLSFFVALGLFLWAIGLSFSKEAAWKGALLSALALPLYYEAATRSDLVTNMLVLASVIVLAFPYLSQSRINRHYILISAATGIMASTRLLTLLPIAILLLPYLARLKPAKAATAILTASSVFILTFIPILMMNPEEFLFGQYPPWLLQSRQGSAIDFLIYIPLIFWMAFNWKGDSGRYWTYTSIYILLFVAVSLTHRMIVDGDFLLFTENYDITYFSTSLPFIILGLTTSRLKI